MSEKQLSPWLFAAMTPALIQLGAGTPWYLLLPLLLLSACAIWFRWRIMPDMHPVLWAAQWLVTIAVLGTLARHASGNWPTNQSGAAVGLILLALAAWSAQKGPSTAARVGGVLFWFIIIMYGLMLAAGIPEGRLSCLLPKPGKLQWLPVVLMLIPAAAAPLLKASEKPSLRTLLPYGFLVLASLLSAAALSSEISQNIENPFYEMIRSLRIFGTARRLEVVISAAATAGWFCLLGLLLSISGQCAAKIRPGKAKLAVWISAGVTAICLLCDLHIPGKILAVLVTIFWVEIPLMAQQIERQKKS